MSDSDDFGPMVANTPNIPRTIGSKPNNSRAAAAPEAGPSRIAAGTSNKRKKAASTVEEPSEEDDVQEIVLKSSKSHGQANARGRRKQQQQVEEENEDVEEGGEGEESGTNDVQEIDPPVPTKPGGGSRKPASRSGGGKHESSGVNGNSNSKTTALASAAAAKSKGKQKGKETTTGRAPKRYPPESAEPMDVDAIEVPDDEMEPDDMELEELEGQENLARVINTAGRSGRVKPGTGKVAQAQHPPPKKNEEVVRLKEQLRQAQKHIDDLTEQLKELCQVRRTEPEQLLERMELQHQVESKAHDKIVEDLMAQLRKDTHVRTGKTAIFELLTRDEVNKETQMLQNQIKSQKEALRVQDKRLKEQEEQIKSLQEDARIAELQLKEEIERGKTLLAQQQRQPVPSSRPRSGGTTLGPSLDPKYGTIISFYEDLTNVIVPYMKSQPGKYLNTDEWILNCCYTHRDVVNKNTSSKVKSLNFTLRLCWEPTSDAQEPITSMDQLVQSVHYIPLELRNESPEFIESLGFLGDNFTFERDQLSLFVRTLHDYISGEGEDKADQTASDDDSVQIVE